MKTLFFECNMGAAGDMLMASLLELHNSVDENAFFRMQYGRCRRYADGVPA